MDIAWLRIKEWEWMGLGRSVVDSAAVPGKSGRNRGLRQGLQGGQQSRGGI